MPSTYQRDEACVLRVLKWILIVPLWLVLFEVGVRLDDWARYSTPLLSPFRSQGQLAIRDVDGMHGRPNARFRKWILNGDGMRGPDVSRTKPPRVYRIITIGASETFGLYESPGREYPRQLEDSLEAMRRSGRCKCAGIDRFEVLNGALLGMSLPTVVQDVRKRLKRFSPDMIVLYPSPVQYLEDDVPVAARPDSTVRGDVPPALRDRLFPRALGRGRDQVKLSLPSVAKDWLRRREVAREQSAHAAGWEFTRVPDDRMRQYAADLRGALAVIREISAVPVLVSHANAFAHGAPADPVMLNAWHRFYPRASAAVIPQFDDSAAVVSMAVGRETKSVNLDWNSESHRSTARLFDDFAHFTDVGAAMLAGRLAETVTRWSDSASRTMAPVSPQSGR
jgi:hypothetical protein